MWAARNQGRGAVAVKNSHWRMRPSSCKIKVCPTRSEFIGSCHGTTMRYLRQEAASGKPHQPRPQRHQAALEHQPASGARPRRRGHETHARLHVLPAQRQSRQSLSLTEEGTEFHRGFISSAFHRALGGGTLFSGQRNHIDFHQHVLGQTRGFDRRTGGRRRPEIRAIDGVHGAEIIHVLQEDSRADNLS